MAFGGNFYAALGYVYHLRGNEKKAEGYYKKALRRRTKNAKAVGAYGVLLMRGGRVKEALEVFQSALDLQPDAGLRANIRLNRAMCFYLAGEMRRAIVALEDLHANYPRIRVYETLGYLYIKAGQIDKAVEYNLKAVEYDSSNPVILDNLGQSYYERGDYALAKEYFEKAYEEKDNQADILYHMGLICEYEGRQSMAVRYYKKAAGCKMDALNDVTPQMLAARLEELKPHDDGQELPPREEKL